MPIQRVDHLRGVHPIARDKFGNVLGGICTPYVDAPSAVLRGEANAGNSFCFLFGNTALFSADEMASLYVDEAGFAASATEATDAALAAGFLLPEDAAIIAWAPEQWHSQTGG